MSKKNKIISIILVIIFIIAIILTGIRGLNVDLNYAEGVSILFDLDQQFNTSDIETIANEIWPEGNILVQKVEVYDETALIKVYGVNDEQLQTLADKVNEKYGLELTKEDLTLQHNSNVQIRDIVRPYLIPVLVSVALIVVYYSIRFKGVKEILNLLVKLLFAGGILFSIYAITELPINVITLLSIAFLGAPALFALVLFKILIL